MCANTAVKSISNIPLLNLDSVQELVQINIAMENNDYRQRVHNYLTSRTVFENMVKEGSLTKEHFALINTRLLAKYNISKRSVFNAE